MRPLVGAWFWSYAATIIRASCSFIQGGDRVRVELADVKLVVAAIVDTAAELAGVLAAGGVHHA